MFGRTMMRLKNYEYVNYYTGYLKKRSPGCNDPIEVTAFKMKSAGCALIQFDPVSIPGNQFQVLKCLFSLDMVHFQVLYHHSSIRS